MPEYTISNLSINRWQIRRLSISSNLINDGHFGGCKGDGNFNKISVNNWKFDEKLTKTWNIRIDNLKDLSSEFKGQCFKESWGEACGTFLQTDKINEF